MTTFGLFKSNIYFYDIILFLVRVLVVEYDIRYIPLYGNIVRRPRNENY